MLFIKKILKMLLLFIIFVLITGIVQAILGNLVSPKALGVIAVFTYIIVIVLITVKTRRKNKALAESYISTILRSGGIIKKFAYSDCRKHFIVESIITIIVALLILIGAIIPSGNLNPFITIFSSILWTIVVVSPIIALNFGIWMIVCYYYVKENKM